MKAIVQNGYGPTDVIGLKEVAQPQLKDDEVLVRVQASSLNAGDLFTVKGTPFMLRFSVGFPKPKDHILGWDVAGVVVAVGAAAGDLKVGDEVFGSCEAAFAEYVAIKPQQLALKPANTSFEEAAVFPTAAITALQQLRDRGGIRKGQDVLVLGASGGVGSFAVQIAKSFGANVTGLCRTEKVEFVRSLGADRVIDYKTENFISDNASYDLILDNVGQYSISRMKRLLTPNGKIVPNSGHGGMKYVLKAFAQSIFSRKVAGMKIADLNRKDFELLKELCESGAISPVVDRVFPLEDTAKALAYLEGGAVKGKVVLQIGTSLTVSGRHQ